MLFQFKMDHDKKLHIYASFSIYVIMFMILYIFTEISFYDCIAYSSLTTMAIGLCKELIYDNLMPGHDCDTYDFFADLIGIAIGIILSVLLVGIPSLIVFAF